MAFPDNGKRHEVIGATLFETSRAAPVDVAEPDLICVSAGRGTILVAGSP